MSILELREDGMDGTITNYKQIQSTAEPQSNP